MDLNKFIEWSHSQLLENDEAQSYLRGRGVSEEQWARHRLGYIDGSYDVDPSEDPGHNQDCSDREKKHLQCDSCHFRNWSSTWEAVEDGGSKIRQPCKRM